MLHPQARGVDAQWRIGPVLAQLLSVLRYQLLNVRQHQHLSLWPVLNGLLAQGRNDVALAAARRQD